MRKSSGVILLVTGRLLVLVAALLVNRYLNYRSSATSGRGSSAPSQVWIEQPAARSIVTMEDIVLVQDAALGQDPFTKTELWINGEYVGLDTVPDIGRNPLSSIFNWTPSEPGFYSLVLHAETMQQGKQYELVPGAGQNAEMIADILPAAEIVHQIIVEAENVLAQSTKMIS